MGITVRQDIHTTERQTLQQNSIGMNPWCHLNTIRSTSLAHSPSTARHLQQSSRSSTFDLASEEQQAQQEPELPHTTLRYGLFRFHKSLLTHCTKDCHSKLEQMIVLQVKCAVWLCKALMW